MMNPTSRFPSLLSSTTRRPVFGRFAANPEPSASSLPLKVAIVYDDSAAGHHALNVLDRLESQSGRHFRPHPVLWRFDRLTLILDRCRAVDDVLDADLVVLSLSASDRIPPAIERWFDACIAHKRGALNLLLLFRDEEAWVITETAPGAGLRTP